MRLSDFSGPRSLGTRNLGSDREIMYESRVSRAFDGAGDLFRLQSAKDNAFLSPFYATLARIALGNASAKSVLSRTLYSSFLNSELGGVIQRMVNAELNFRWSGVRMV